MTIDFQKFEDPSAPDQYSDDLQDFIVKREKSETALYRDTQLLPTIGVGYMIKDNNSAIQNAVFEAMGLNLQNTADQGYISQIRTALQLTTYTSNTALQNSINSIMEARYQANGQNSVYRRTFAFDSAQDAIGLFHTGVPTYENRVNNWLQGIPESNERIVLVSLAYNGALHNSDSLKNAIIRGDRNQAYYEILFATNPPKTTPNSSGVDPNGFRIYGLQNRRELEADLFGISNTKDSNGHYTFSNVDEAAKSASFFKLKEGAIDDYLSKMRTVYEDSNGVSHFGPAPEDYDTSAERQAYIKQKITHYFTDYMNDPIHQAELVDAISNHPNDNKYAALLSYMTPEQFNAAFNRDSLYFLHEVVRLAAEDSINFGAATRIENDAAEIGGATVFIDPLILDLDNDGIDTIGLANSTAFFDLDGDGMAEHVGWVGSGDGILALDKNANGKIDNLSEVFGDGSATEFSPEADGYASLARLDSNNDGVINNNDEQFQNLLVWQDLNQNGISETDELKSLLEVNIASISLAKTVQSIWSNGNYINATSTFTRIDSSVSATASLWFGHSLTFTRYFGDYDLGFDAWVMPTLRGYGKLKDLTIAMSMDTTLLSLVQRLAAYDYDYIVNNQLEIDDEIDSILYRWAGVEEVAPQSRGGLVDARHLGFIERYLNTTYIQDSYNPNPTFEASEALKNVWHDIRETLKMQLLFQAGLGLLIPDISYDIASDSFVGAATIDANVLAAIQDDATASPDDVAFWRGVVQTLSPLIDAGTLNATQQGILDAAIQETDSGLSLSLLLETTAGQINVVTGISGDETLNGTSLDDDINGLTGNNTLNGLAGNDRLAASDGNNVFNGGAGYNTLLGGTGDDIYIVGQGRDIIRDGGGNDELQFVSGITASDLTLTRYGNRDLVIDVANGSQVVFNQHFMSSSNVVETVRFSDNSTLDLSSLAYVTYGTSLDETIDGLTANGLPNDTMYGLGGNDQLYGHNGNDYLDGGAGNDRLYGNDGNDTLIGGTGSNALFGGLGDDVYIAGTGNDTINDVDPNEGAGGFDTIQFAAGITASDLTLTRTATNSLLISIAGGGSAEVMYQFNDSSSLRVEQLRFADSSTLDLSSYSYVTYGTGSNENISGIASGGSHNDVINGLGGNDLIYTGDGNDTLIGGLGNDALFGGTGDDVYVVGQGNDVVSDYDPYEYGGGADAIQLGAGVTLADLTFTHTAADSLLISIAGGSSVEVQHQFNESAVFQVEQLRFADSSTYNLLSQAYDTYGTEGNDSLYGIVSGGSPNDAIYGLGGNDQINGRDGNDYLNGGDGNDNLYGNSGNDTLIGGAGNDSLYGGSGDDVYAVGDGNDVVSDYDQNEYLGGFDTIQLGAGVTLADLTFAHTASDSLLISIAGGGSVELQYQFNNGAGFQIEQLRFADDTTLNLLTQSYALYGTEGGEFMFGNTGAGSHNDTIYGLGGNDQIHAGDGNDTIIGGAGNDGLYGGSGDDVYIVGSGDDVVSDYDQNEFVGGYDTVQFGAGIALADLTFTRTLADSLLISIAGGGSVELQYQFNGSAILQVEQLRFADDSTVNLLTQSYATSGSESADMISAITAGGNHNDIIYGRGGNDQIYAGDGNDTIVGGTGDDILYGESGDDTYMFARGDGADIVVDNDSTSGNYDALKFASTIDYDQLWLTQSGSDLQVSVIGTNDSTTIVNWFNGASYHIEEIDAGSMKLVDSQVSALVTAMASYTAPSMGQTTMPTQLRSDLDTALAAAWQAA